MYYNSVHSEANTRRIRVVEQCFGSNGEVHLILWTTPDGGVCVVNCENDYHWMA